MYAVIWCAISLRHPCLTERHDNELYTYERYQWHPIETWDEERAAHGIFLGASLMTIVLSRLRKFKPSGQANI